MRSGQDGNRIPMILAVVEFERRPHLVMFSEGREEVAGEMDSRLAAVLASTETPAPASA